MKLCDVLHRGKRINNRNIKQGTKEILEINSESSFRRAWKSRFVSQNSAFGSLCFLTEHCPRHSNSSSSVTAIRGQNNNWWGTCITQRTSTQDMAAGRYVHSTHVPRLPRQRVSLESLVEGPDVSYVDTYRFGIHTHTQAHTPKHTQYHKF